MNAAGNATYFLFDLHCRNSCGITDGEPGFSVLINFDSSFQIERYIEGAYQLSGRVYLPYFQVQFISVIVDTDELAIIQLSQISYFRRMKRQQKLTKNLQQEVTGIVTVKLKTKLQYRGHVYFQSVIMRLLQYLKLNNPLYHDIEVNLENVPNFLINEKSKDSLLFNVLSNIDIHKEIPIMFEKNESRTDVENDIQSKSSKLLFQSCLRIAKVPKTVI